MEKEWTIIFLIYADFFDIDKHPQTIEAKKKLIRELQALYSDLKHVPVPDNCSIYTVLNSIKYKGDKKKNDNTFIHKVDKKNGNALNSIEEIASINTDNALQRTETLSAILSFITNLDPPSKILLITWDHGSVFGINKQEARTGVIESNFRISLNEIFKGHTSDQLKEEICSFSHYNKVFKVNENQLGLFRKVANNSLYYNFIWEEKSLRIHLNNDVQQLAKTLASNHPHLARLMIAENGNLNNNNKADFIDFIKKNKNELEENIRLLIATQKQKTIFESPEYDVENLIQAINDPNPSYGVNFNYELEILTNGELADSIQKGINKGDRNQKKVDVLLMMN